MLAINLSFITRFMAALGLASAMTVVLLLVMKLLIESDEVSLEAESLIFVDFVSVPEMTEVRTTQTPPVAPAPPEEMPPLPEIALAGGETLSLGHEGLTPPTIELGGPDGGLSDGPYLPLVKVQPVYPRRALARGIEGYAIIEFDVRSDGGVVNPRVIDSSHAVFDAPAKEAATKFRYKPMVRGGEPVPVYGVQNRFTFQLGE